MEHNNSSVYTAVWKEFQYEKIKTALYKHSWEKRVKNSISSKLTTISSEISLEITTNTTNPTNHQQFLKEKNIYFF